LWSAWFLDIHNAIRGKEFGTLRIEIETNFGKDFQWKSLSEGFVSTTKCRPTAPGSLSMTKSRNAFA
jgi:hypothetical protein